ncbi:hypothetical protein DAEQUDRAFT_159024 [Daedalea quercina L-15889]|uniref:Extracellular mutant protein 11 C-terminal domain-containing protein n=1 Tax=Daedalea quercina L-15889 TaxID=1314783 RepID=A0A165KL87_9APHY|nr:hypothetical protein DAEQUDRAFT_159024 [Daedalea quercina L-15889]
MSARVPFMPQRPASRQQPENTISTAHDSFRPTGLLPGNVTKSSDSSHDTPPSRDAHIPTRHSAEAALKAANNKPLNLAGLAKRKPVPQANGNSGAGPTRKSFDGSGGDSRAPKPFLPPSQAHRLSAPRPSSPLFSGSTSSGSNLVSTNGFRPPMLPVPSKLQATMSGDELSANLAHTTTSGTRVVSSASTEDGDTAEEPSGRGDRYEGLYSLGFNSTERGNSGRRTASQPSLEKINEAEDEEEDTGSARPERLLRGFPDDTEPGSDDSQPQATQHGLRRSTKRIHQPEFDEDEFAYGTHAKRYKPDGHAHDGFAAPYSRGPTPDIRGYIAPDDYGHRAPSEPRAPERPYSRMSEVHVQQQPAALDPGGRGEALYKLLGQELTVFVEGHVDAYEEAKKKWSECSMEEWRAGADELTTKFAKMLDFVKGHMSCVQGFIHVTR